MSSSKIAVVLLSGGLDSTTCLALAKAQGYACYGLSFDYGQRHRSELVAAAAIASHQGLEDYKVVKLDMAGIGGSALTDTALAIPEQESDGIPLTYVPARNTVFLAYAMAWAEVLQASAIFIGINAMDYSGYPDCRPAFVEAFQTMANLATRAGVEGHALRIEAPLLHLTKADIIRAGIAVGVDYAATVSCYQADLQGRACGVCDSCRLRKKGFREAGIADPTHYRDSAL